MSKNHRFRPPKQKVNKICSVVSEEAHTDSELTDSNIIDKGYQIFTILVITEKNKNLFLNSQRDKTECHCSSKILQCQNRYLPSFRFLLGGLRFRKVMPLSSSKAVTSRSSGDCSFGRSPSPMYSIQVLPTSLGSEYIDTPGYTKTITIRCAECIQVIKHYIIFKWLIYDTWTKNSFSSSKSLVQNSVMWTIFFHKFGNISFQILKK